MAWWLIVLIAYFGINLILAILIVLIGFGLTGDMELMRLFIRALFFGLPIIIYHAIGDLITKMK